MVASMWKNPFVDRAGCIFQLLAGSGGQMKALTQKVFSMRCIQEDISVFQKFLVEMGSTIFFFTNCICKL